MQRQPHGLEQVYLVVDEYISKTRVAFHNVSNFGPVCLIQRKFCLFRHWLVHLNLSLNRLRVLPCGHPSASFAERLEALFLHSDCCPRGACPLPSGPASHRCCALRDLAQRLCALAHKLLRDAGKRRQGQQPVREATHHRQIGIWGTLTLVSCPAWRAAETRDVERGEDRRLVEHSLAITDSGVALWPDRNSLCAGCLHERRTIPIARLLGRVAQNE